MVPESLPEEWFERVNRRLSERQIPHAARPFEALSEISREFNCAVDFPSPLASIVFAWFERHSPTGSHAAGALFTAAFYFDAFFWKVNVPIAYGTVRLNALDWIEGAPEYARAQIQNNREILSDYMALWTDAMDYGYGIDEMVHLPQNSAYCRAMASSADQEIRATVRLLTEDRRPNSKAMETSRMATEMFLKAYLAAHEGLTDPDAKAKFGHNIDRLAARCEVLKQGGEFGRIQELSSVFPKVEARYSGKRHTNDQLWIGYCVAQFSGTAFVRSLTDRDSRPQFLGGRSCAT
jgi:hypothetical protein